MPVPMSSIAALQGLFGVSPTEVPYSDEELAEARGDQQQGALEDRLAGEKANTDALGITGAQENMRDRLQEGESQAMEGQWAPFLDRMAAQPFAAANRGLGYRMMPSRGALAALGKGGQ